MASDYKQVVISDSKKRLVEGFANCAVLDRQGDVVPTSAMVPAMLAYMSRGGPILLGHANKPVGKVVQWSVQKVDGSDVEGIHIIAMIDEDTGVGDEAWKMLQDKQITGFSIGGVAGSTESIKDKAAAGGVARKLVDVELNEISLVQVPANQLSTVENISVAKSCDSGECDMDMDDNGHPIFTTKKLVAKMIEDKLKTVMKDLHRGPFDTKAKAEQEAQNLKQVGNVVYRIIEQNGGWYIDFGFPLNPANTQAARLVSHPEPKARQHVLMAMKGIEHLKAMGLDWEPTREEAERVAREIKENGFHVYEIVQDGAEWRIDYGTESTVIQARKDVNEEGQCHECGASVHTGQEQRACIHGEEKAEDAPDGPTFKEQDGNYDQQIYGVQTVDGGLVKGGNEAVRRKVGFEVTGSKVRSVGPNGARGIWHLMSSSEKQQVQLYGQGELAAATNVPSGYQPGEKSVETEKESEHCKYCVNEEPHTIIQHNQEVTRAGVKPQTEKEEGGISTGEAGVENARYGPGQPKEEIEKPFKSRAQSRWMFWAHPKMAREWAGKTDYSNLPERKKELDEGDIGHENESQAVVGEEAFVEHTEGSQGDKYGEFGAKGMKKGVYTQYKDGAYRMATNGSYHVYIGGVPIGETNSESKAIAMIEQWTKKRLDAGVQPNQMQPGYQEGKESSTGKPVMHEMPGDSCDMCGKKGTTRRGVCEECESDEVNESRAKKGMKKYGQETIDVAPHKPHWWNSKDTCIDCGQHQDTPSETRYCPAPTGGYSKNGKNPTDDANVGPNGLAGESALHSGLDKDAPDTSPEALAAAKERMREAIRNPHPAKEKGTGSAKGSGGRTVPNNTPAGVKSMGKSARLLMALAGGKKSMVENPGVQQTIQVAGGTARYVGTEVEDANGRWNDRYSTRDGYWVIHHGNKHDVYRLANKSVEKEGPQGANQRHRGQAMTAPSKAERLRAARAERDALDAKYRAERYALDAKYQPQWDALHAKSQPERDALDAKYQAERAALYAKYQPQWDAFNRRISVIEAEMEKGVMCKRCGTKRVRLYKRARGPICSKCIKYIRNKAMKALAGVKP